MTVTVGAVVRFRTARGAPYRYGTVSRVGSLSLTVRPEDGSRPVVLRRRYTEMQWPVTVETPAVTALRHWGETKPRCARVHAYPRSGGEIFIQSVVGSVRAPADLDAVIAELAALRDWLARRPS